MSKRRLFIIGLITCFTLVISPLFAQINSLNNQSIQSGDLIFREGTELISDLITQSEENSYSHVGMLYKKQGLWFVIHATPPETKDKLEGVVIEPLTFFIAKERSKKYGIYKVKASAKQHQQALTNALQELNKPFRLDEKEGTYCTLLIYRAWQKAEIDLEAKFTPITLPFIEGDYILPKDLANSKYLIFHDLGSLNEKTSKIN